MRKHTAILQHAQPDPRPERMGKVLVQILNMQRLVTLLIMWIEWTRTDNVTEAMKSQAKASYSQFSDLLDKGITMKAISDPYRQQAAQLLEVSPETISMNDNKYSQMLSYSDGKSPTPRAMSLGEAAKHIKSQEEYHFTKQANQEAASLASMIANKFGAL